MMDSQSCRRRLDVEISKSSGLNKPNESLLMEIFSRLPCREATRFKLVCKEWNTVISSDYFITLFNHRHHDLAESPSSYRLLLEFHPKYLNCNKPDFPLLVHCGSSGAVLRKHELDLGFLPCRGEGRVNASCGDLILCSYNDNPESPNFYLCNPQTKQWVALPSIQLPPGGSLEQYIAGLLCVHAPCLLCHHGNGGGVISNKFKFTVVLIRKAMVNPQQIEVVLFSSDEGRWRNHLVSSPLTLTHLTEWVQGNVVAYKGKLHWLNYPYVLVYDPYNDPDRISRAIELGTNYGFPIRPPIVWSIAVFHDRLRIAYSTKQLSLQCHHVWELEDYDMGTWSLVHEVRYTELNLLEGHVLHDGNAFYVGESRSRMWLCSLRNGAVDTYHKFELVPAHQKLSSYFTYVHQIADLLPTPLPSFEW